MRIRRAAGAIVITAATALVASSVGPTAASTAETSAQMSARAAADGQLADWTMMVYAVGDTVNVSELMVENLTQLAALPDAPNVNVVVLVDLPERTDKGAPTSELPGIGQFTTAKLLKLEGGRYEEIRDLGEVSMGRQDVLSNFVAEAADRFPAKKYGFTFFDHGGGNTGGYLDIGPPGAQSLSVPAMRNGLIAGMQQAGIDRFDLINHAACLMSNYETVSALAPLAKTMSGSEEIMIQYPLSPQGFPAMGQNQSGDQVANAFIEGYGALLDEIAVEPGGQTYRDLLAMSVVDGDRIKLLDSALESFSQVAVQHMPEIATAVARARAQALEFVIGIPGQEDQSFDLVDLGDFLRHLTDVPADVAVARDAAFAALQGAVTHQLTGQATQQATGLNVYLPANPNRVESTLTDGTEPPGWRAFIEAYLTAASGGGGGGGGQGSGGVQFVSPDAQVLQADQNGIKIGAQLASGNAANVTSSETQVYTKMGDASGALALVLPAYLNAGGEGSVQGVWNYAVTALTDGQKVVPVTAGYKAQSGGLVGSFLAQYTTPSGGVSDVGVRLLLTSQGQIQSVTTVDVSNGTGGGVALEAGGKLTPYIYVPSSGQFVPQLSSQSIAVSDKLQVAFSRLPTGTAFNMGVVVSDVSGSSAGAFTAQQVK